MTFQVIGTVENATGTLGLPAEIATADQVEEIKAEIKSRYAETGDTITFQVI